MHICGAVEMPSQNGTASWDDATPVILQPTVPVNVSIIVEMHSYCRRPRLVVEVPYFYIKV